MQPTEAGNLQRKRGTVNRSAEATTAMDQLAAEAIEVLDEIETISKEGASLEDIEGAKALASSVVDRYDALMKQLGRAQGKALQRNVGGMIARIRGGLTRLKEAPE